MMNFINFDKLKQIKQTCIYYDEKLPPTEYPYLKPVSIQLDH